MVDVTPFMDWLIDHTRPAVTIELLSARTGIDPQHLRNIRAGTGERIHVETAAKLQEVIEKWETTGEI